MNDRAFEMAVSSVRFGAGVTREVGMDLADMGCRRVLVLTDTFAKPASIDRAKAEKDLSSAEKAAADYKGPMDDAAQDGDFKRPQAVGRVAHQIHPADVPHHRQHNPVAPLGHEERVDHRPGLCALRHRRAL